jgi:hypothetical protein
MSNLMHTTRFSNYLREVRSIIKINTGKPNNTKLIYMDIYKYTVRLVDIKVDGCLWLLLLWVLH